MVFTTPSQGGYESEYAWIISKYQPVIHCIEYIVSTANRYWVISIHCTSVSEIETSATIVYTYTGLNSLGNEINKRAIAKMYRYELKDWEEAINYHLETGNIHHDH